MSKKKHMIFLTILNKIGSRWYAGYYSEDKIIHYIEDAKVKDELIHKLIRTTVHKS